MSSESSRNSSPRGVPPSYAGFGNNENASGNHPGQYQQKQAQSQIMRPPIGFGTSIPATGVSQYPSSTPTMPIPPFASFSGHAQPMAVDGPPQEHRKKKKRDKDKSKSTRDHVQTEEYNTPIPYASPAPNPSTPFLQPPAFRVNAYASGSNTSQAQHSQSGSSYYPDQHPEASTSRNKSSGTKNRNARPETYIPPHGIVAPPAPDTRSMAPQENAGRPYSTKADQYLSSADPPGFPTRPAAPAHVESHHKSRSQRPREHRSNSSVSNVPPPQYATSSAPQPSHPPQNLHTEPMEPPARPKPVLRILTVLIEDKRTAEADNQLAEVRVGLRPADDAEDGFWADAKEVVDELQSGPARIDGPAKVYAMRGRYRQYFLRVTADGSIDCQPANLKVTRDRTLEVFVEFNPAAVPGPSQYVSPPPPIPSSASIYSPNRSDFGNIESVSVPRKRRHSNSSRSSVSSSKHRTQGHAIEDHASHRSSPFTNRAPSVSHSQAPDPPMSPTPVASHDSPGSTGSVTSALAANRLAQQLSSYNKSLEQGPPRESPGSRHGSPMSTTSSPARSPVMPEAPVLAQTQSSHPSQSPFTGSQSGHNTREQTASPAMLHPGSSLPKKSRKPNEASARSAESGTSQWGSRGSSIGSSTATPALSGFAKFTGGQASFGSSSAQGGSQAPVWQQPPPPTNSQAGRDVQVVNWLRGVLHDDPSWHTYVEVKDSQPPVLEMLQKVFGYVQHQVDTYVDTTPSSGLGDLRDTKITKTHILKVFNVSEDWWKDRLELYELANLYGPNGSRYHDADAIKLLTEKPLTSTTSYVTRCLKLLQEVHSKWNAKHPGA